MQSYYYVRVLEIPTPRWSTYDAKALGIAPPEGVDATIHERTWVFTHMVYTGSEASEEGSGLPASASDI